MPVRPREDLQEAIDGAEEGAALCLEPGVYRGPIRLERAITLFGSREAVVRSSGTGTTVRITAPNVAILGVTIDGSGERFDTDDAALAVEADHARVEGITVERAVFGILLSDADHASVSHNRIVGDPHQPFGLRGDSIRLWQSEDSTVEGNVITDGRDMVLWYSSRNRVAGNVVSGGRYGIHLMYSHDNELVRNRFEGNTVGAFLMYSRGVRLEGNTFVDMSSSAGMGIGLKESSDVSIRGNRIVHCATGLFIDTSPFVQGSTDVVEANELALNDVAVVFHGKAEGNVFRGNALHGNREQVRVGAGRDAMASTWSGNSFDDYRGYDLDEDGSGDVDYEVRALSAELTSAQPMLAFFEGTPALSMVDVLGTLVPLFAPRPLIRDPAPYMHGGPRGGERWTSYSAE